jgi:hypothetical protein
MIKKPKQDSFKGDAMKWQRGLPPFYIQPVCSFFNCSENQPDYTGRNK